MKKERKGEGRLASLLGNHGRPHVLGKGVDPVRGRRHLRKKKKRLKERKKKKEISEKNEKEKRMRLSSPWLR